MQLSQARKRKFLAADLGEDSITENGTSKRFLSEKMAQELNSLKISPKQQMHGRALVNRFDHHFPLELSEKGPQPSVYWKATASPFLENSRYTPDSMKSIPHHYSSTWTFSQENPMHRNIDSTGAEKPCRHPFLYSMGDASLSTTSANFSPANFNSLPTVRHVDANQSNVDELESDYQTHQPEQTTTRNELLTQPLVTDGEVTTKIVVSPLVNELFKRENSDDLVRKLLIEEAETQCKALVLYKSPPGVLELCKRGNEVSDSKVQLQGTESADTSDATKELKDNKGQIEQEVPSLQSSDDEKMEGDTNLTEELVPTKDVANQTFNFSPLPSLSLSYTPTPISYSQETCTFWNNTVPTHFQPPLTSSSTVPYFNECENNNQNNIRMVLSQNNLPSQQMSEILRTSKPLF
jgi:hypothetical protein